MDAPPLGVQTWQPGMQKRFGNYGECFELPNCGCLLRCVARDAADSAVIALGHIPAARFFSAVRLDTSYCLGALFHTSQSDEQAFGPHFV